MRTAELEARIVDAAVESASGSRKVMPTLAAAAVKRAFVSLAAVLVMVSAGCASGQSSAADEIGVSGDASVEAPETTNEPQDSVESDTIVLAQPTVTGGATQSVTAPSTSDSTDNISESTGSDPNEADGEVFADSLLGMTEGQAEELTTANGFEWRVVERDGVSYDVGQDFSLQRLNATVVDGLVAEAHLG